MRTSKSSTPSKHWQMPLQLWRQRKSSLVHMKKCETVWNTCSSLILSTLNRFKRFNEFVILSYLTCVYKYIYSIYIYIYSIYIYTVNIYIYTLYVWYCYYLVVYLVISKLLVFLLSAWHHPWAPPPSPPAPDPKISKSSQGKWFRNPHSSSSTLWLCLTLCYWTWPSRNSGITH